VLSRHSMKFAVLAILFTTVGVTAAAEDAVAPPAAGAEAPTVVQLPPWMTADVLKAAVQINMTDAQKPEFNTVVGQFVTDHFAMIQKELKRGAANLDMTIKSRDNALVHTMDDQVHKILTKEQWPAYENYRKVLRTSLKG